VSVEYELKYNTYAFSSCQDSSAILPKSAVTPMRFGILVRNSLIPPISSLTADGALVLRVSVRFFTSLREIVDKREETLEFPDGEKVTVDTVLKFLAQRYGKRLAEYVYDGDTGQVRGFLQFLVNGKSASTMNGLQTELKDGDVLAILPPVGGG
jgi:molybdopterin synthase sulfur carrier subunit